VSATCGRCKALPPGTCVDTLLHGCLQSEGMQFTEGSLKARCQQHETLSSACCAHQQACDGEHVLEGITFSTANRINVGHEDAAAAVLLLLLQQSRRLRQPAN
jgi:hypothetical protein